jgi:hypothetical protein
MKNKLMVSGKLVFWIFVRASFFYAKFLREVGGGKWGRKCSKMFQNVSFCNFEIMAENE